MADQLIGEIKAFGFNFAPRGWAKCEGQILSISQNSALFDLLGTTYGGDGRTTFGLPDLRGRAPIGAGTALSPIKLGEKGGNERITLSISNLPPHAHNPKVSVKNGEGESNSPINGVISNKAHGFSEDATPNNFLGGVKEDIVGNGTPIDIRSPYLGINYCIALVGIYPSRN